MEPKWRILPLLMIAIIAAGTTGCSSAASKANGTDTSPPLSNGFIDAGSPVSQNGNTSNPSPTASSGTSGSTPTAPTTPATTPPATPQNDDNNLAALTTVTIPEPPNLSDFIADKDAAIRLGKALFWDMQVGSDGVQACASCHFHAGADNRAQNEINPGHNGQFDATDGPNQTVSASDFPLQSDDVMGSMGVQRHQFNAVVPGSAADDGTPLPDPVFNAFGSDVRAVTGRNAPSVINAVFNFSNFWDGRANHFFNGNNPFGPLDQNSGILVDDGSGLVKQILRLENASLASQAVGPPGNKVEMSYDGRTFPDIGKKMLSLKPLGKQAVSPTDSVLGALADTPTGLTTTYQDMIRQAFQPRFWTNASDTVTIGSSQFTQIEANFALFFGLAVQAYEATLISNQSPFDRYAAGDKTALTTEQVAGLDTFTGAGRCAECHSGALFSKAAADQVASNGPIRNMSMAQGSAFYDTGFYNISVRPTGEDAGRHGTAPFVNPLTGQNYPLSFSELATLKQQGQLPPDVAAFTPDLPGTNPRTATNGSFKVPSLRNVELTGPYFHNGSAATLRQVVEFYTRGGNFPSENIDDLDPEIAPIGKLVGNDAKKNEVVSFLQSLTDERVRQESAPFDHPQLLIPADGSVAAVNAPSDPGVIEIPSVGAAGRAAQGLPPLQPFLGLDPHQP